MAILDSIGSFGEAGLIKLITRWLRGQKRFHKLIKGGGDDCATTLVRSQRILFTNDALVERVHFKREWMPAWEIGWKALIANVSDIAAAGGTPVAALISLELPASLPVRWLKELYAGLLAGSRRYQVALAGGNISAGPHVAVHISLAGEAPAKRIGRGGARPGNLVVVTGALGGSLAGLRCLQRGLRGGAVRRAIKHHFRPLPNLAAGRALARLASAQIDISDGLAHDAEHIASASGVQLVLVPGAVPVHRAAAALASRLGTTPVALALGSGEEYELLATIPRTRFPSAVRALARLGVRLTPIGEVRRGKGLVLLGGASGSARGFDHFR